MGKECRVNRGRRECLRSEQLAKLMVLAPPSPKVRQPFHRRRTQEAACSASPRRLGGPAAAQSSASQVFLLLLGCNFLVAAAI
jgi:hypothetical protein